MRTRTTDRGLTELEVQAVERLLSDSAHSRDIPDTAWLVLRIAISTGMTVSEIVRLTWGEVKDLIDPSRSRHPLNEINPRASETDSNTNNDAEKSNVRQRRTDRRKLAKRLGST
jgi:hypothetical protein